MNKCKYCNKNANDLKIQTRSMAGHVRFCFSNPLRIRIINGYKNEYLHYVDEKLYIGCRLARKMIDNYVLTKEQIEQHNLLNPLKIKMSSEAKNKISLGRKKFLKENPDKHPWKISKYGKSVPCEIVKDFLRSRALVFEEEFQPLSNRFFSIDIAFPSKQLGIEINGNQHYDQNGQLKEYYKERHSLISDSGWTIFEIHYSIAYNEDKLLDLYNSILHNLEFSFEIAPAIFKKKNNLIELRRIKEDKLKDLKRKILLIDTNTKQWTKEASIILGISPNTVRRWIRREIPDFKM